MYPQMSILYDEVDLILSSEAFEGNLQASSSSL